MKRSVFLAAFLAVGLSTAVGAWAQNPLDRGERAAPKEQPKEQPKDQPKEQPKLKSIGEVVAQIGRQTPGRMTDSKTVNQEGTVVYQIQWVTTDNRRITFVVDAQSGRILSQGR